MCGAVVPMNLADRLSTLQARAERQRAVLDRQKKTETALVLPFFDALGYDPFDVRAVEPEASTDDKENGRADYVLRRDGTPLVLVECTEATRPLDVPENHVLLRRAALMGGPLVLFTNGLRFQFYTGGGTEAEGLEGPVLDFDLLDYTSEDVAALRQLARPVLDMDTVRAALQRPICRCQVREYLTRQRNAPDDATKSPGAQEEAPGSPSKGEAGEGTTTGVFGKDIVKHALEDLQERLYGP